MAEIEKVIVTKGKLDTLANSISAKSGESLPMTITEMISAVDGMSGGDSFTIWETMFDQDVTIVADNPNYVMFTFTEPLGADETYRITWGENGTQYICETTVDNSSVTYDGYYMGNGSIVGLETDTGEPFFLYRNNIDRMVGGTNQAAGQWHIKIEKQVDVSTTLIMKTVTENGTYSASDDSVDGYSSVTVNVPPTTPNLQSKTVTPTESVQTISADSNYDGLDSVEVGAISSTYIGSGVARKNSTNLTASGATVTVPAGYYEEQATKSVATTTHSNPTASINTTTGLITASHTQTAGYVNAGTTTGTLQLTTQASTTITPSESTQVAVAANKYTLGAVNVAAIPSTYIGSDITARSSSDLTSSGATVTVPSGYYEESASKTISSGSVTTPATTITANPSISIDSSGLITATASASKSITPTISAGYVSTGTSGTVTVNGSNTQQLTTLGATTYNTSTTDQTITSGKYITGTQTIKAVTVSGLSAENIVNGVTVKVGDANDDDRIVSVTGSLVVQAYYTGSSDPSDSLGNNGDIYLKVVE